MGAVDVVRRLYRGFAEADMDAVLGAMDPAIRWHEAEGNPYEPSGRAIVGPEAVVEKVLGRVAAEWSGFEIHPGRFHDTGDVVVVEGRYTGTHNATGRALDAQVCHLWTVVGDRITGFQQYVDTAALQDAMGARPPSTAADAT